MAGWAIINSYPATNIAEIAIATISGNVLPVRFQTAHPVAMTIADAAASPHLIRLMFPDLASCSWKKGEDTVNQDGQNPANTPDASPMRRIIIVMSSLLIGYLTHLFPNLGLEHAAAVQFSALPQFRAVDPPSCPQALRREHTH